MHIATQILIGSKAYHHAKKGFVQVPPIYYICKTKLWPQFARPNYSVIFWKRLFDSKNKSK